MTNGFKLMLTIVTTFFITIIIIDSAIYPIEKSKWKCNDWQIINDKPECYSYVIKIQKEVN